MFVLSRSRRGCLYSISGPRFERGVGIVVEGSFRRVCFSRSIPSCQPPGKQGQTGGVKASDQKPLVTDPSQSRIPTQDETRKPRVRSASQKWGVVDRYSYTQTRGMDEKKRMGEGGSAELRWSRGSVPERGSMMCGGPVCRRMQGVGVGEIGVCPLCRDARLTGRRGICRPQGQGPEACLGGPLSAFSKHLFLSLQIYI